MKHWKETRDIAGRLLAIGPSRGHAALATVVRTSGSSYRRPGARFLMEEDGQTMGGVSGGCLEDDVREIGFEVMRSGTSRLVHYDTSGDDSAPWGLGLGCQGSLDVYVQPASELPAGSLRQALDSLLEGHGTRIALATIIGGPAASCRPLLVDAAWQPASITGRPHLDGEICQLAALRMADGHSGLEMAAGHRVFIDVLEAPPRLVVCGGGNDARPLVAYAADVGFAVTVIDHRSASLTPSRFPAAHRLLDLRPEEGVEAIGLNPATFVVVKTHSLAHDVEWVRHFVRAGVGYLGLLGSHTRRDEVVRRTGADVSQLFSPVGLDLGADGPEQIAISIVAELLAFRMRRAAAERRERTLTTCTT